MIITRRGIEGHLSTYIDGSGALKHRVDDNDDIVIRRTVVVDTLESDTGERGIWYIYRRARELKTVSLVSFIANANVYAWSNREID